MDWLKEYDLQTANNFTEILVLTSDDFYQSGDLLIWVRLCSDWPKGHPLRLLEIYPTTIS